MHKVQRTVLIVDDAQADRTIIRHALHQDVNVAYHLLEAENGAQALVYLRQQQPDCLLLACELPDTDGVTLLQTVMQQAAPHLYPVVMLTGVNSSALAAAAMQQGAHDFLSKAALRAEQVQRAVNNAIEKVALLRQLEEQRAWSQSALASVSDAVITTDAEGCVTFMNPTAEALTGWSAGAAQGQALDQIFRLHDKEITRQLVADLANGTLRRQQIVGQAITTLLVGQSGPTVAIEYTVAPIHNRLRSLLGAVITFRDVSTRKSAEEALSKSEARLNTILQNIPLSVYMLTPDQRYLYVNRHYEQLANVTNAEIQGKSIYDMFPLETAIVLATNDQRALAAKAPLELEEFALHEGELRTYASIKTPLLDANAEPYAIIGISTDITERKRAERNRQLLNDIGLALSKETDADLLMGAVANRVGDFFAAFRCGFADIDLTAGTSTLHHDWCATHAASMAGTYGIADFLAPEFMATLAADQAVFVSDVRQDAHTAAYAANWAAFGLAAFVFVPIFRAGVWKALFFIHLDKPQQWRADEIQLLRDVASCVWPAVERARSEEQLRLSERRLKLALEAGNMVAWEWNPHTNQIVTTDNFHSLYGLSALTWAEVGFDLVHPDDRARHEAKVQQVVSNGGMYHSEFRIQRADTGQQVWLEEWGYGTVDAAGQVELLVGVIRDITSRKVAEHQLAFHASLLDYAYDAVVATDAELNITVWNRGAEQMYGWQAADVIGRRAADVLQSGMTAAQRVAALRQMQAGNRFKAEVTVHHRNGAPMLIEGHNVVMHDATGQINGYMSISRDISERMRAEEALRTSEANFRTLANAMPQLVWTADAQGRVDYYNMRIEDYDPATRLADGAFDWTRLVHPDDLAPTFAAWQAASERGEPYTFEHRLRMADHSWRWHLSLAMPMQIGDNQVKWYGTATDIHERKQIEEALRASEAQLNAILYNIPASVYILTTDHRYLLVNRIYEQENNISNAEIHGQSVYDRWSPQLAAAWVANEQQVLATKATVSVEETVPRDGEMRIYATIKAPLLNAAGEPYAIIGISTDITERKRAEEGVRRREEQLRAIINAVPGLIAYIDQNERYQFVNATYGHWFARPIEEIEGHTVQELSGSELYQQGRDRLEQVLAGQEVKTEATFAYPDGVTRTLLVNYIPHLDATGQPQGFYVVDTDISERKQAEALLRQQADLLDQAHDAIIVWELGGVIRYWNRGAEAMYGWTNTEALGQVTHQLLQTQHPLAINEFEQILRGVGQWIGEVRHIKRNGQPLVVESRYVVTRQTDGVYLVLETNRDISERKQAEAALRASEERYRTLFETMDEGFCIIEMLFDDVGNPEDYRFLEVNPTFERFTGLKNAVGKTARHLVPGLESHWFEIYGHVALTGEPRRFVEGSAAMGRWFEVYAFRFGGAESRRVALLFNNITERKRAEDQLRSQEELLRQIADNVPGLIAYIGADERYRFVNATFETWFQRPRQQIIGSTVGELIGKEEHARFSRYRQQALAGEIVSYEMLFTYPDGVTRTVWGRYQPHLAADGTVPGFYLFVMDITERKQAEEQVRASEARFRQLAEAMPQIVWVCNAEGEITYINEQWQVYSGLSFAQTLEHGMWPALHPDDQARNQAQWQHALQSGLPYEAELRLRRADGEYRWHLERAVPIRNAAGVIEQWFGASFDIDDHKRAQDALARANERFALAENASNGWVYDFDVQKWTAERSPGFSRILGYAPEEISPDVAWWHNLFHPEDWPLIESQAVRLRDDAEFTEVEYRIRHRDGHYVHLLDRSRNIHNAAGQRVRVVGITVDISERKRAELHQQFLSALGMQLRLLSDIDTIVAHLVHRVGEHLMVSGCRVNEIDLAQNQFIVQKDWAASGTVASGVYPLAELAPPTLLAELQAGHTIVVANTMTDPRTAPVSDNYRTNQTTAFIGVPIFRQGQWSATLSVRAQGERRWRPDEIVLLETVANQFQPLLEKVRAEQALRHSEERLRLALEGGGLGIWEWHIPTDTATWTEQEYALFGLAPNTPITRTLFASLIHVEDRAEFLAAMDQLTVQGGDFASEFRITHPNGEVRWLAERCVAIADAQGRPERVLGVNFDITERKATEHALQQFNEQLEYQVKERTVELTRRLQELDQFAYVASHDLKAPLRAIDHLAQWISADTADLLPPASHDHLEKMRGRIIRMEKLLDDLLAYSRADRYQYNLGKVDVAVLLDDIVRLVTPPQGFAVSLQTSLPILITQKVPLETVLRNLINNAIKHHDRTDGQVQVAVQELGEFFEFSVSDDGPGIEPEFHERIFQIFQTLRPRDQVEGSGMGLAIVKKIVESRNGRISVTSTPGRGATFRFTWPKE